MPNGAVISVIMFKFLVTLECKPICCIYQDIKQLHVRRSQLIFSPNLEVRFSVKLFKCCCH